MMPSDHLALIAAFVGVHSTVYVIALSRTVFQRVTGA